MEAFIIGLDRNRSEFEFSGDPFCGMALRAGRQRNPAFMDRRIRIQLRLDPVNPMAGGAGRGVRSSPGGKDAVNAPVELLHDVGMTDPAGVRYVGTKDGGFRIDEGPQAVASVATGTGHHSRASMNAPAEELSRGRPRAEGMGFDKFLVGMAPVARLGNIR